MAENVFNAGGNVFGGNQAAPVLGNYLPGTIYPYLLPPSDQVEKPFEPISKFAIWESGQYGPLNEEQLTIFLKTNLDKRLNRNIVAELRSVTPSLQLFIEQLERLQNRMSEIRRHETQLNKLLKIRIRDIIRALTDSKKELPSFANAHLPLTNVAREALQQVASEGPLGPNLVDFIQRGRGVFPVTAENRNAIIMQLNQVHLKISDINHLNKINYDFNCKKIIKAIGDFVMDISSAASN